MTMRSYHQLCGLAYALDIVGERWTLLIIRELYAGPRRFTDLLAGLPEISTNLLTERLKSLEQQGLIRRRALPPPEGRRDALLPLTSPACGRTRARALARPDRVRASRAGVDSPALSGTTNEEDRNRRGKSGRRSSRLRRP